MWTAKVRIESSIITMAELAAKTIPTRDKNLLDMFFAIRQRTLQLTAKLSPEDQCIQGCFQASPTKWHLAHVSWFFETFLLQSFLDGYQTFNPHFNYLFNSYYNGIGKPYPRENRGLLSRPSLDEVLAYRNYVDEKVSNLLQQLDHSARQQIEDICTLGMHHEQQHQELLLTDIKTVLANNPMDCAYGELPVRNTSAPPLHWRKFEGALVHIGARTEDFCFDNELPQHLTFIHPFQLASRPVTNGEYLEFICAGGYQNPAWWLADGWEYVKQHNWQAPLYWALEKDSWQENTLGGRRALNPQAPVCHISYFEADAFARWRDCRLPTEAEWELAARQQPLSGNLAESGYLHPMPMALQEDGLHQIYGDVWEWTSSAYAPYPGFKPLNGSLGEYNGKFMSGQYVLRGGSCVTPASHIRASYRNFFYPRERWQFSGLRLARDLP